MLFQLSFTSFFGASFFPEQLFNIDRMKVKRENEIKSEMIRIESGLEGQRKRIEQLEVEEKSLQDN
jgi:hypothetical protein